MTNSNLDVFLNSLTHSSVLNLRTDKLSYVETSVRDNWERFFHIARILPGENWLGWQLAAGIDKTGDAIRSLQAFASPGCPVTEDDFRWIFQDTATLSPVPESTSLSWPAETPTYRLRLLPDAINSYLQNIAVNPYRFYTDIVEKQTFEFWQLMKDSRMTFRLLAGPDKEGGLSRVALLLACPGGLPLRTRAVLSYAFPFGELTEVGEETLPEELFFQISSDIMINILSSLLEEIVHEKARKEGKTEEDEVFSPEISSDFLNDDTDDDVSEDGTDDDTENDGKGENGKGGSTGGENGNSKDENTADGESESSGSDSENKSDANDNNESGNSGPDSKDENSGDTGKDSKDGKNSMPDKITRDTLVHDLPLSVRTIVGLHRAGIRTIGELKDLSIQELLMKLRSLGVPQIAEIRRILAKIPAEPEEEEEAVDYRARLAELIGLDGVKTQVRRIEAFAKMKRDMASRGISTVSMALNMAFLGNPGTAKTTVARILAGILHEVGILSRNSIVEVGRADLVGKYVGHTADRVKEVFKKARGKLLFIDEAYSLVDYYRDGFGDEAINTIVQEMENHRDETVVVFAGYPREMEAFIARNPGLSSRIPFTIEFTDYSPADLTLIARLEAEKKGFTISSDALQKVQEICRQAVGGPTFGNGRFCRNLVENAILSYADRVYGSSDNETPDPAKQETKEFILTAEDFEEPKTEPEEKERHPIGFCA